MKCSGKENCENNVYFIIDYINNADRKVAEISLCGHCFIEKINTDCKKLLTVQIVETDNMDNTTLTPSDEDEEGNYCNKCASGLLDIELARYGHSCTQCSEHIVKGPAFTLDGLIHNQLVRIRQKYEGQAYEGGNMPYSVLVVNSILGSLGYKHKNQLNFFGKVRFLIALLRA